MTLPLQLKREIPDYYLSAGVRRKGRVGDQNLQWRYGRTDYSQLSVQDWHNSASTLTQEA